jgi:hypothetical protein
LITFSLYKSQTIAEIAERPFLVVVLFPRGVIYHLFSTEANKSAVNGKLNRL